MLVKGMKEATGEDGAKLTRLLNKGLKLAEGMAELKEAMGEVETALLGIVAKFKKRGDKDPVSLTPSVNDPRGVNVKWNKRYVVDVPTAVALEAKLGEIFQQVFSKKIEINRARSYGSFMENPQTPKLEALKPKIAECVEERFAEKPSIKWVLKAGKDEDEE
jgi:hypothetical protein